MFRRTAIFLIEMYQLFFSPDQGIFRRRAPICRFYPTCSEYAKQAIDKYGLLIGLFKGMKRIGHCHPFNAGGHDPLV